MSASQETAEHSQMSPEGLDEAMEKVSCSMVDLISQWCLLQGTIQAVRRWVPGVVPHLDEHGPQLRGVHTLLKDDEQTAQALLTACSEQIQTEHAFGARRRFLQRLTGLSQGITEIKDDHPTFATTDEHWRYVSCDYIMANHENPLKIRLAEEYPWTEADNSAARQTCEQDTKLFSPRVEAVVKSWSTQAATDFNTE